MGATVKFLTSLFARGTFEEVTNARLHAIVNSFVLEKLAPLGFEETGDLKWVRDRHAPIRHVFGFAKLKGAIVRPMWGVSLDFVPHVSGKEIKWHRSNKAAKLDLYVEPYDRRLYMSYIHGEKPLRRGHASVVTAAIPQAMEFWARCQTIDDLWDAVTWLKTYCSDKDTNFNSYTQHPLTMAFLLARAGRHGEARNVLEKSYVGSLTPPEAREKLRKLVSEITPPSTAAH